jgi:hypothetical protein
MRVLTEATAPREPRTLAHALLWFAIWKRPRVWFAYSLAFGVAAPLVCFGLTTRVATFISWSVPMLVYALTAVGALLAWLALGRRSTWLDALLAGVLGGATAFSLVCCALAVPLALIAVAAVAKEPEIAALGTLGFLTAPAFLAYAVATGRAFASARKNALRWPVIAAGLAGSLYVPIGFHAATELACRRASLAIVDGARPLDELHLGLWRVLTHGREWDELVEAYRPLREFGATASAHAVRIERGYELATGKPIRWRFYD